MIIPSHLDHGALGWRCGGGYVDKVFGPGNVIVPEGFVQVAVDGYARFFWGGGGGEIVVVVVVVVGAVGNVLSWIDCCVGAAW